MEDNVDYSTASDEVKLALIKEEMSNLVDYIKVQLTIQTTLEAYRQSITGEIPEEFNEFIESDEFKTLLANGISASNEILRNTMVIANNVGNIFGVNFIGALPSTYEEFNEMAAEMKTVMENKAAKSFGWDID
jgi:hypothetical protein